MVGRISFFEKEWARFPETHEGVKAVDFLAHLWRTSPTFQDAVRRWEAENPQPNKAVEGKEEAALAALLDLLGKETTEPINFVPDGLSEADQVTPMNQLPGAEEWRRAVSAGKNFEDAKNAVPVGTPFRRILDAAEAGAIRASHRTALGMLIDKQSAVASAQLRRALARDLLAKTGDSLPPDISSLREGLERVAGKFKDEVARAHSEGRRPFPSFSVLIVDIEWLLLPLLFAFHDPKVFFIQLWPQIDPRSEEKADIAVLLKKWGVAVLLNPIVYDRFARGTKRPSFVKALAEFESRQHFAGSGGRKKSGTTRDYSALAVTYYGLSKGEKRRWIDREAGKQPQIDPSTLLREIRKKRPK